MTLSTFDKILVANRGEIAQRIFRACRALKIASAAIYSEADAGAPWVLAADEAVALQGVTATDTYLNQARILEIAKQIGAQAIHPGYGFLSENAEFAAACAAQGITFIGPSPRAIFLMGSKARARELAVEAGVPVTPGFDGGQLTAAQLRQAAAEIEYPVLIKASAGGGGKGMRVVWEEAEFDDALRSARSEAHASFGDDHIILEKFFTTIHHVEVQILGDQHGNVVHLFERECSIQRRHQKIIEETPAPCVTPALREAITAAAVKLARAVDYANAGTIEFIVTPAGEFYFLEMNTRLQVEHPITELVTGIDLAQWQIRVASGERLGFSQQAITQTGHAIECRIYAEDPANHFLPSIGTLSVYQMPQGPGVRVDDGLAAGSPISPYYDPMIAKLIVLGATRQEAIGRMEAALRQTIVTGVTTNVTYLQAILQQQRFLSGDTPTSYLEQEMGAWPIAIAAADRDELLLAAAAFEALSGREPAVRRGTGNKNATDQIDPWRQLGAWRNVRTA